MRDPPQFRPGGSLHFWEAFMSITGLIVLLIVVLIVLAVFGAVR